MKKNVIHIIVDAYCYNNLKRMVGKKEVTPFLNSLSKNALYFERMFAQAPYTEASQVTLLSGENTLDNGGYMFGNATVTETIFSKYRKAGYKTVFMYSPYVYSKAYLTDVNAFYYTRLVSLQPLYMYRLQYYCDISRERPLTEQELTACIILLGEAIETWKEQCTHILNDNETMALIRDWVKDMEYVAKVNETLDEEIKKFHLNPKAYIQLVFDQWQDHILRKMNQQYNVRTQLSLREKLLETYQPALDKYQEKYSRIVKKHTIDLEYVIGMVLRNKNGINDAKNTFAAYRKHWNNTELKDYLKNIDEYAKTEVSINRAFEVYEKTLCELDAKDEPFYAHIHVQDFHLPSVFHSVDTDDFSMIADEFAIAFELLDAMDKSYRGNIIADLSARYCDRKIELFYNRMKSLLKKDFVFTITADHGFPCYENPPRPMVYNQTYTEAFHIPLIICDGEQTAVFSDIYSNIDGIHFEMQCAGVEAEKPIPKRDYVLCEYGGPGCPDIGVKPIWYTYIGERWRISAECSLTQDFSVDCIKDIYDIKNDPFERKNLLKSHHSLEEISKCAEVIANRHDTLRKRFAGDKFLEEQLKSLSIEVPLKANF